MSNISKRILLFTTAYRPFIGGSEVAIEEIVKRLPDVFFDIITPRFKRGLPQLESGDNFCIHRIGWGWPLDKLVFPVSGFLYSQKLVKKNRYDFFHAFQASYAAGAAWLLKFFYRRIPFILTIQEGKDLDKQNSFIRFCRKLIIKKADRTSVISNYLKDYVLKIRKRTPISVIPNGVDLDAFSKEFSYGELSALKDELGIKPGEKAILSFGRLAPKNGLDSLIRAAALLGKRKGDLSFKLLLVGDGEQKRELLGLARALGIKERVIFAGSVERSVLLPKYLKISDVFVRPSLSEGLGNAFLEAMAASIPVIGTPVGGIPDFLKDEETGLFCEVGNPEDIAQKIEKLVFDDSLRKRIIENGLELVKEKYDWGFIAAQYIELYD
jgi:glycosyltransferase involved in cell wall biosynthesis